MKRRVRAVLIDKGIIVLLKRVKKHETYYVFPGGGVEGGENLEEALRCEMKEELGVEIFIEKLLLEKQFEKDNLKQNEYFYLCKIIGGILGAGTGPEYKEGSNYEGIHEVVKIPVMEMKNLMAITANKNESRMPAAKKLI